MKEKSRRTFYFSLIMCLVLATVLSVFIVGRNYVLRSNDLEKIISQTQIDGENLSISLYEVGLGKKSNSKPVKDLSGQIYYYNLSMGRVVSSLTLLLILIIALAYLVFKQLRDYEYRLRAKFLKPFEILIDYINKSTDYSERDKEDIFISLDEVFPRNSIIKSNIVEAIENLETSEQNRRDFTANVTHELKTPLTSINGYAEMIYSGLASEKDVKRFSSIILDEGNKLLTIIDEIIQLSKYDSLDPNQMKIERFDLGELAQQIVLEMKAYGASKNVDIFYEGKPLYIDGDKQMIYELINNLTSNAIKYSRDRGYVRVKVSEFPSHARIEVEDEGIGISPEDQERIFERFYMVSRSGKTHSGTGLGLSLAKHIVLKHNGEIYLESELNKGSKFFVDLPKKYQEID